jgi:hypothetical protein
MQEVSSTDKPIQRNPYDIESDKSEDEDDKDTAVQQVPALLTKLKLLTLEHKH